MLFTVFSFSRRHAFAKLSVWTAMVALSGLSWVLLAQTPPAPREEEEALPTPPKRTIVIEEEGPPAVKVPRGCYYVRLEDLARAAADSKNAGIKALLQRHIVAFDRMEEKDGTISRVCPVPLHRETAYPDPFGVFKLNDKQEPQVCVGFDRAKLQRMVPYEEVIATEAERLFKAPSTNSITPRDPAWDAPAAERYFAAEQLLAAALSFHDSARDASKRRGTPWESVRRETFTYLAQARLARLKDAGERKDWVTIRSLGTRMASLYASDLKLLEEVFATRLIEAVAAAESDQLADLERSKDLLVEFESRFPGSKNPKADEVRTALRNQAKRLYDRAATAIRTEDKEATRLLRTLEILDPNYPGLRDLFGQLKGGYTILNVGVARMPVSMSPLTARSDSEKMAVELLFEGLYDAVPDELQGVRYVPNLADGFPAVQGGARGVRLQRGLDWAGLAQQYCDASDVAGTVRLLKADYRGTWAGVGVDYLADTVRVDDPASLRMAFAGSHPYPLSLLDFKILPTRWLAAEGLKPDDIRFGLKPYGTGPFKAQADRTGRVSSFVANPAYGRRPGKLGQPFIKEVQFVDIKDRPNLAADFKTEKLHALTDVPTADLAKFTGAASGLVGRVQVVTAPAGRRVWMLALNHRKPSVRSVVLRRGLALAIDRELILNSTFRSGFSEFHKAMSGPFPPDAWAVPRIPLPPKPLFDKDLAAAKLAEHLKANGTTLLRLAVPADDPRARAAAEAIARQVGEIGRTPEGTVTITVDALPPDQFDRTVFREMNFDMAYLPFDYPNDLYPYGLAELLDPSAANPGGRNLGGYLANQANTTREDEDLARLLGEVRHTADYTGRLVPMSAGLHRKFLETMPFIPLWQLDRHMVLTTKLQISFDDDNSTANPKLLPPTFFRHAGRWKLD